MLYTAYGFWYVLNQIIFYQDAHVYIFRYVYYNNDNDFDHNNK